MHLPCTPTVLRVRFWTSTTAAITHSSHQTLVAVATHAHSQTLCVPDYEMWWPGVHGTACAACQYSAWRLSAAAVAAAVTAAAAHYRLTRVVGGIACAPAEGCEIAGATEDVALVRPRLNVIITHTCTYSSRMTVHRSSHSSSEVLVLTTALGTFDPLVVLHRLPGVEDACISYLHDSC